MKCFKKALSRQFVVRGLPFVLLFLFSLPAIKDLLKPGAYTSHDLTHHIVRIIQMDKLLKEGQIPPRWAGELNYGFGYPIFLFNYPLPHFFGALFHFLGFNFVWSAKMVFLFSMVLSCFTAFVFFQELWQDKLAAFLGSIFYLYAPIRFVNVYVSATIGNALGFTFIPLIFWAILKLARKKQDRVLPVLVGALNFAFLVLSHNILALIFAPIILSFTFLVFWQEKKLVFLKRVFVMFFLGLGLACFFWLPAVIEKKYIRYDGILQGFYKTYFPSFRQLIHSPWGYGFDHPGTEHDAMPFQIGLTHILVIILTFLSFLFYLLKLKNFLGKHVSFLKKFFQATHQNIERNYAMAIFFFCFFFIAIFFILRISIPIYERIYYLQYVQHPWRFLALSVFCATNLAAFLVKIAPGFFKKLCFFSLLFLVLYANRNHLRINQVFNPGEEYYLNIRGTTTMAGEHLPEWARQMDKEAESKLEVVEGEAKIELERVTSAAIKAKIAVEERATLVINHFYFPGWRLFVNNQERVFEYRRKTRDGLPTFTLEKGDYHLKYILTRTAVRKVADIISLVSMITGVGLWLNLVIRKIQGSEKT